jgi:peptide/nickel transport system permease protein
MAIPNNLREEILTIETRPPVTIALWSRIIHSFRQDPRWWFAIVLLLFVLAAIFAPQISPYPPLQIHLLSTLQGPSVAHLLGTDELGRDALSRIIYGTRISLTVGVVAILLGGVVGTVLGIVAAYFKGWVDQLVTMIADAILSFPGIILVLAIAAALGPSVINVVVALAFVRIPVYARLARGQALQVSTLDYVTAATLCGTPTWKILLRHVLPNIASPLLVQATLAISNAILDETLLSFLGLGAQPPTPEWGSMISDAQTYLSSDPWMLLGPTIAIVLVVLSLNLLGDAVRDRLDPRTVER